MPHFQITGRGRESGRKRKRTYTATDPLAARKLAEEDGTVVDEATVLPEDPPTEAQVSYARDLGLDFPVDITKAEISDLLDCHLSGDKLPSDRHRRFADWAKTEYTQYTGKRNLFDRIAASLKQQERDVDLVAWFVYRVCRHLMHGKEDHPQATGPESPLVCEVADSLAGDPKVIESVRRYDGRDMIWFGQWTAPDGAIHEGGSIRTAAYARSVELLRSRLGLGHEMLQLGTAAEEMAMAVTQQPSRVTRLPVKKKTKAGCVAVIVGLALAAFLLGLVLSLSAR